MQDDALAWVADALGDTPDSAHAVIIIIAMRPLVDGHDLPLVDRRWQRFKGKFAQWPAIVCSRDGELVRLSVVQIPRAVMVHDLRAGAPVICAYTVGECRVCGAVFWTPHEARRG